MKDQVIGAVQAFSLVVINEGSFATTFGEHGDATVSVFASRQSTLGIECQTIGTRFQPIVSGSGVSTG